MTDGDMSAIFNAKQLLPRNDQDSYLQELYNQDLDLKAKGSKFSKYKNQKRQHRINVMSESRDSLASIATK